MNPARSQDEMPAAAGADGLLAFELGDLVDIPGLERCVFVGRRVFDVTVDTDSAAMDDSAHACFRGRFDTASTLNWSVPEFSLTAEVHAIVA